MDIKTISLISSCLGLIGGVLLAYSLNRVLDEIRFCIKSMSTSIASFASNGDVYIFIWT